MEEYEKYDVLEFDNGKKYIVVDTVNFRNHLYLYLANEEVSRDYIIVKEDIVNGEKLYNQVFDKDEFLNIAKLIAEKNKDLINELLNEVNTEAE
jgi:hypothetical protein